MKIFLSILLVLFVSMGCKSTKKLKELKTESTLSNQISVEENVDLVEASSVDSSKLIVFDESEETIVETSDVVTTNTGQVVVVPRTTSTIVRRTYREEDSLQASNSKDLDTNTSSDSNLEESAKSDLDLTRKTEGMNPIEDMAEAIFPSWGKILIAILSGAFGIGWKIYQNKKAS